MSVSPNILLTRPETSSAQLRAELETYGYSVYSAPMLTIRHHDPAHAPSPHGYQAIVITSANAATALKTLNPPADLPVMAVGDATARTAQSQGMRNVTSAAGDSRDLRALLDAHCAPDHGALLYVRGRDISTDLAAELSKAGWAVNSWIAYAAEPVPEMPGPAGDSTTLAGYDAVLFFSRRTARRFAELVRGIHGEDGLRHTRALCISHKLLSCLEDLPWGDIHVARRPDRNSMIALTQACVPVA